MLAAGFEQVIVTDSIVGLQPGFLYKYEVIASNSDGREGYVGDGFLTCSPQGGCGQPYLIGESLWVIEGAERVAKEAPKLEEEREAKQKEEEERPAKEAAVRAAHEREIHEAGERAGREAAERERRAKQAAAAMCHVPSLRGDSLDAARRALRKGHCNLGKVSKPRKHHAPLVVRTQSIRAGRKLAKGAAVAVHLGPAHG